MRRYSEVYTYDSAGNLRHLLHNAQNGRWGRSFVYQEASRIEPDRPSNRLSKVSVAGGATDSYAYDAHGNMTAMPHLLRMDWDFRDQLRRADLGGGGVAHYTYDAGGQRVRKVVERNGGALIEERITLGGFEIFRRRTAAGIVLERETLHVMDDRQRIALVDTCTRGQEAGVPAQLIRYQFGNHLGSAALEVDAAGQIISYEEYHPYGSTAYQSGRSIAEVSLKRYRYTGMERDAETGLGYHSARYYAPWLARWTSADPAGTRDDVNLFAYARGNPVSFSDRTGLGVGDWIKENVLQPAADFLDEHGIDDAVAGFGDNLSFGLSKKARRALEVDSTIDYESTQYKVGDLAGNGVSLAMGGAGIAKSLATHGAKTTAKALAVGFAGSTAATAAADAVDPSGWTSASLLTAVSYLLPFASKLRAGRDASHDATDGRLKSILEGGGPSGGDKAIAAAQVDVSGYTGRSTLIRARSGKSTPTPSQQDVPHSPMPDQRTLSTHKVNNAPNEHAHTRARDAEIKIFEEIQQGLPSNARGTVYLATDRPMCPSCTTAAFEFAGNNPGIRLVVFAPTRPVPSVSLSIFPAVRDLLPVAGLLAGKVTPPAAAGPIDTGSGGLSAAGSGVIFTPDEDLVPAPILFGVKGRF
jgi:RHS repeat-associated protein